MKKIIILLPILLLLSSCGPEFVVHSDQTTYPSPVYPELRIVVINNTNQAIEILTDKSQLLLTLRPREIKTVDVNFCYEGQYILAARKPNGEIRYRNFWCYYSSRYYVPKEIWEIY